MSDKCLGLSYLEHRLLPMLKGGACLDSLEHRSAMNANIAEHQTGLTVSEGNFFENIPSKTTTTPDFAQTSPDLTRYMVQLG